MWIRREHATAEHAIDLRSVNAAPPCGARTRKRPGRRPHLFMAPSDLTHLHTAPDGLPASRRGVPGAEPQTRHSVASVTDLALARFGREIQNSIRLCRTEDPLDCLSFVARPSVEPSQNPGPQVRARTPRLSGGTPLALVVHPQSRRSMERADGQRILRRTPDDVRLGRARRQRGLALPGGPDAGSGDRVPPFRLLRLLARRAVAEYVATLSRVSVRVTDRV